MISKWWKNRKTNSAHWQGGQPDWLTHIRQVKGPIGIKDNGEDGEDNFQEGKLEGSKFEQEERAPVGGTEETIIWKPLMAKPGFGSLFKKNNN